MKGGHYKHEDFNIISYSFECYSEEIFHRIFGIIRARIKNSIIVLGAKIGSYERLRIFLNAKDNNYALNLNPMVFKDYITNELSNLILLQGGDVILDAYGNFKSGIEQLVLVLKDYINNLIVTIDNIFPLDE